MDTSTNSAPSETDEAYKDELNHMIRRAGWFPGSWQDWEAIPFDERKEIAFRTTGCQFAYATWAAPVDCLHPQCLIRRGQLPRIAQLNQILRAERAGGWLRFIKDRSQVARIFRYYRRLSREKGVYDPWALDWQTMVSAGIGL